MMLPFPLPTNLPSLPPILSSFPPVLSSFPPVLSSFPPVLSSFPPVLSSFPPVLSSFPRKRESRVATAAAMTVLLWASIACAGGVPEPSSAVNPAATGAPPPAAAVIRIPTAEPPAGDEIQSHLATKSLEVGTQRVAFLLSTRKALVKAPQVEIAVTHPNGATPAPAVTADYNEWPYGVRGSYAVPIEFPVPGDYQLAITPVGGAVEGVALIQVKVLAESSIPSIGDSPPASQTKTLADGIAVTDLTTDYEPDAELYRLSVADAISSGRPTVIVFATPAFCASPTCGPQVDTVSELRAAHPDAANYVHVELYDNPAEIQGDLSRARLVPAADEWGFTQIPDWTNESWVFVLDGDGIVRHRFEGFATLAELEAALAEVASQ